MFRGAAEIRLFCRGTPVCPEGKQVLRGLSSLRRLTVSVTFQTAYPPSGGVAVVAYNGIGMPVFGKTTVHVSGVADIETLVGNT